LIVSELYKWLTCAKSMDFHKTTEVRNSRYLNADLKPREVRGQIFVSTGVVSYAVLF